MSLDRISRVLDAMADEGLSQMLVCDTSSIYYLTGVSQYAGERLFALYITSSGEHKFIANRLFPEPQGNIPTVWHSDTDDIPAMLAQVVDGEKTLGIDKVMPARFLIPLQEKLPGMKTVLASGCVDWVRAVKDEDERELMRMNSKINDLVMLSVPGAIKEGVTESQVAEFIKNRYLEEGCQGVSFSPIVSFGANAADPHHMPDDTVIKDGDCIVIDIGGKKDGYCSDMTRTYFFKSADPEFTPIHDLVRSANERAESIIKPGVRLCDIDAAARDLISDAGYGEYFTHRLGHFIGMNVHEYGDVSSAYDVPVKEGMCFSIEPGVYLPGRFGVRVEDLVIVTKDGCEVLNSVDKHWKVID